MRDRGLLGERSRAVREAGEAANTPSCCSQELWWCVVGPQDGATACRRPGEALSGREPVRGYRASCGAPADGTTGFARECARRPTFYSLLAKSTSPTTSSSMSAVREAAVRGGDRPCVWVGDREAAGCVIGAAAGDVD